MTLGQLTSRAAVEQAMVECDRVGVDAFLARYGFHPARRYRLVFGGRSYDSKAIAGVAHGYEFPEFGPLRSSNFSGGQKGAAGLLRKLGFQVVDDDSPATPQARPLARTPITRRRAAGRSDVVLLGCVKGKRAAAAAASGLYMSPLFLKRRVYAEASGLPWYILSALHGLLRPDEVIEPYDLALKDRPAEQRRQWGDQVLSALERLTGPVAGKVFEVHAGDAYATAMRSPLMAAGGWLLVLLAGLRMGEQLGWYDGRQETLSNVVAVLGDSGCARPAAGFPWERADLDSAGLYSWWVDDAGADELSRRLGNHVPTGLVYAGQAGATRQPSGLVSGATLSSRIGSNHLRGRITSSTWRRTLGSILVRQEPYPPGADAWSRSSEALLSRWMCEHLRVAVAPVADRATLAVLERALLEHLDPPLTLEGMSPTPTRSALRTKRALLGSAREAPRSDGFDSSI